MEKALEKIGNVEKEIVLSDISPDSSIIESGSR